MKWQALRNAFAKISNEIMGLFINFFTEFYNPSKKTPAALSRFSQGIRQ